MLGTYASLLVLLGAAALCGQAILTLSGRREWTPLAPAVGLAGLCALTWWTVRLPGEGAAALAALVLVSLLSAWLVAARAGGGRQAAGRLWPIGVAAVALGSLPFLVEGRFGILGTGLNPDMSQHLFAVDRLAAGGSERLIAEGYPLGPHSLVVALSELGPSTVQAFDGLMLAIAVCACLVPAALFERGPAGWLRLCAALSIGFAYLFASYYVQGSFKETMEALFLLAFAVWLVALGRGELGERPRLAAIGPAVLAAGCVYVYSFPGLLWPAGALAVWAAFELIAAWRDGGRERARGVIRAALAPGLVALAVLGLAIVPEGSRMVDFAGFETFNPSGAGLGNLFDRLSPLEAFGVWPSGDFRVEPGDGAVPAVVFYLGSALALAALAFGLAWSRRRGERAVAAALTAAVALWLYALLAGTPYQEAKALLMIAPLAALISARALAIGGPPALAVLFLVAAGGSSLLALANGPVGPPGYSPALAELRTAPGAGQIVVVAAPELLDEQHGRDFLAWELRGNRVCVFERGAEPPAGLPPGRAVAVEEIASGYSEIADPAVDGAAEPCPLIPDGARADPSGA